MPFVGGAIQTVWVRRFTGMISSFLFPTLGIGVGSWICLHYTRTLTVSFLNGSDTATASPVHEVRLPYFWITHTWWLTGLEIWAYARGLFWHLALRYLTLSDSERKVQGKTCFSFFLTTCVRSIALFPLQISFEAPVRWISSEAHFTCAQKRLGYLKSQLLLLDFNQNWERVDKAWCKFPMPNVRNNNGSLCVLCGQSGRHVEAEACIYDGSLRPR